jgi:copper(I)-binding protein
MSFAPRWEGPAVVLVDLPDERIRGDGVASLKRTESGQVDVMLNATSAAGESFELHLHCYENQTMSMFSGPLESTGS